MFDAFREFIYYYLYLPLLICFKSEQEGFDLIVDAIAKDQARIIAELRRIKIPETEAEAVLSLGVSPGLGDISPNMMDQALALARRLRMEYYSDILDELYIVARRYNPAAFFFNMDNFIAYNQFLENLFNHVSEATSDAMADQVNGIIQRHIDEAQEAEAIVEQFAEESALFLMPSIKE